MNPPTFSLLSLAALLAAIGVALGAYSAHGLENHLRAAGYAADLAERLDWFKTGVQYHLYHALALALVGLVVAGETASSGLRVAAIAFLLGIALFSGSLYVMTLAPVAWRKLGAVVPLGGLSFIVGWLALAQAAWRR
jgi:uncharacterized membrane protein YgdD (TMEM256/DUF423 family)